MWENITLLMMMNEWDVLPGCKCLVMIYIYVCKPFSFGFCYLVIAYYCKISTLRLVYFVDFCLQLYIYMGGEASFNIRLQRSYRYIRSAMHGDVEHRRTL
jgi:hypothetical protein